eukprot:3934611-Rhodomonas_salina.4
MSGTSVRMALYHVRICLRACSANSGHALARRDPPGLRDDSLDALSGTRVHCHRSHRRRPPAPHAKRKRHPLPPRVWRLGLAHRAAVSRREI